MDYSQKLSLYVKKSRMDYIRGMASIYSMSASNIVALAIELCKNNHDVFKEFIEERIKEHEKSRDCREGNEETC